MKKTIFFKIFSGYFLITLVISSLLLGFSFKTIRSYYISTLTAELKDFCALISQETGRFVSGRDLNGLDRFVKAIDTQTHKRVTVIALDGVVLADSEQDPAKMENHGDRPEVIEALNGKTGVSIRHSATVKQDMLYVAVPVMDKGRPAVVLRVSLFLKDVDSLLNEMKRHILNISAFILIAALAGAFVFSKSLSVPISRLSAAARKVAAGDFGTTVALRGRGEIKDLYDSFNHMTGRINDLFAELSGRKDELDTIINSLQEGLLVIGSDNKVKLVNDSFVRIAGSDNATGRYYWEILRVPAFKELMDGFRQDAGARSGDIAVNGKVYDCSVTRLKSGIENIAVFRDVTDARNLEKKKKDLVANVSHELKTPLTAIKGFIETIENDVEGETGSCVGIIKRNTERLINIVEDLLVLSEIEEKGFKLVPGTVNLKNTIEHVLKIFEQRLKEKGLSSRVEIEASVKPITADPYRIEQLLINLVDNSVKYTEKGGIQISVAQDGSGTVITVSDTGIGIPRESLPHVFERFYVVDRSRSKKTGGTGLGLAIVKHIVLLHNGGIEVDSEPGSGTKFRVTLPSFAKTS